MLSSYAFLSMAPALGLALYCVSHVVVSRLAPQRGCYYPLFVGFGIGLIGTLATNAGVLLYMQAGLADALALSMMNLAAYLAFAFGYFNFINLNVASLRIRMLQELMESGGTMPAAAFAACYKTEDVIDLRIDRLVRGGHLIEEQGRFYSGKKRFLVVGRIFDFLRFAILGSHPPGERSPAPWHNRINRETA